MIKVHWYHRESRRQDTDLLKWTVGPGINLSIKQIMMYEEWCRNQFGQEKSLYQDGDWERISMGFFTFKKKEDMLLFLLT